ncbi:MAG: RdgB/HAM1 family non-canonical purine NTP pyrophosphatase [Alphaproteobacteria bacterium]|nr:RdgB/HAM1 family non-canonical purine NTP pyrophosphatase [Alphaproteobacteria bacterium]
MPQPLILATHNQGKLREFSSLLSPLGYVLKSASELGLPEPEETGQTFEENALLKARHAASAGGFPALADDSGLEVPALSGAPGIYSARWAGPQKDFHQAMKRVWDELEEKHIPTEKRFARFVCVLALILPNGDEQVFSGEVEGTLTWPPRGDQGFGYDPIFVPTNAQRSFGEMTAEEKHTISHRARATGKLLTFLSRLAA